MSLCRVKFDDFAETRKVPFSALEKYNPFSSTSLPAEELKNNEGAKERERIRKIKAKAAQKEKEESRKRREADRIDCFHLQAVDEDEETSDRNVGR